MVVSGTLTGGSDSFLRREHSATVVRKTFSSSYGLQLVKSV